MRNNSDIKAQLESEIEELEYKIKNRKKYNRGKKFKYILIKALIILELAFPFVLGLCATKILFDAFGKTPIKRSKIVDKPSVQYIVDSNENEKTTISYNEKYDENLIEYSTGWILNNNGLFERQVTIYELNDKEIRSNYRNILSLSKDELATFFKVIDYQKIQKTKLDETDLNYETNYIVIKQVIDDEKYYRVRNETDFENFLETFVFFFMVYIEGFVIDDLIGMILKRCISTKIEYYELVNRPIKEKDIEELKKILALKKENLKLLK